MVTMLVRDSAPRDHEAILELNNAASPHVNALTTDAFAWLAANADYFRVAQDPLSPDAPIGFVLAMRSGLPYWSLNYRWFSERYDQFLYLDRVVVADGARRRGVGRLLYDDIVAFARGRWPCIALEVNLRPPNPGSLAFHERQGFERVGVREDGPDAHAVVMLRKEL
jgi:predicted GNAT superfamily acetyltransferase